MSQHKNKIILIPGYGTGVTRSIFKKEVSKLRGFEIFSKTAGVEVFEWGRDYNYSFLQSLNPLVAIKLYFQEKKMVLDPGMQEKLYQYLQLHKPQTIVAHSQGTVLLTEVLKNYPLPYIKKIIFVQSDLRMNNENQDILKNISSHTKLLNVHCFWDQALLSSLLLNQSVPLGLKKDKIFQNHFIPLWRTFNLHESSLNDPRLLALSLAK